MVRLLRRRHQPVLSVVVPMYNVEDYLDACLTSIRKQRYRSLEIVIVDDGSPDGSLGIAQRHARQDGRIRIVRRPNGGLSAARNTGVEAATGEFLTFVDSDDLVTPDGLAVAMASLQATGSDIAVLQYGRLRDGKPTKGAPWIRRLHAEGRMRATLDDCPEVMFNASAWSLVFRRDFYDSAGLRFVEGVVYEDQAFSAEAYAKARTFDVLETTGYLWRVNESSMSQGPGQVTVDSVLARLDAADNTLAVLADRPAARAERALQYLQSWLANSLLKLERADDAYLDALMRRMPAIIDIAPDDRYAREVPAQYRVLNTLLRNGDHDAVWHFVQAEGMQPQMHPSGSEPAGLTAYLPGWGIDAVPAASYVLTGDQTQFQAKVVTGRRLGPKEFELDVQAWFQNIGDIADVSAVVLADGRPLEVTVTPNGQDAIVSSRQGAERRYEGSGLTLAVRHDLRKLPSTLDITLTGSVGGLEGTKRFPAFRSSRIRSL